MAIARRRGVGVHHAECAYVQLALPGEAVRDAGVLLLDCDTDHLYQRFRRDWRHIASKEDAEVLEELDEDLREKAREMGGEKLLAWLEREASNTVRISEREAMEVESFEARLDRLYREHVTPLVLPFETHLPVYSLRAAAGRFGAEQEVQPEGWEEIPEDLKPSPELFVGRVEGRSMEPKIPSGSLCVFRAGVAGSRQHRLLLVENFGVPEQGGRYTVKRYRSSKAATAEGWRHTRIALEPLNPEFESWELGEGDFRVIAEFVRVLRVGEEAAG